MTTLLATGMNDNDKSQQESNNFNSNINNININSSNKSHHFKHKQNQKRKKFHNLRISRSNTEVPSTAPSVKEASASNPANANATTTATVTLDESLDHTEVSDSHLETMLARYPTSLPMNSTTLTTSSYALATMLLTAFAKIEAAFIENTEDGSSGSGSVNTHIPAATLRNRVERNEPSENPIISNKQLVDMNDLSFVEATANVVMGGIKNFSLVTSKNFSILPSGIAGGEHSIMEDSKNFGTVNRDTSFNHSELMLTDDDADEPEYIFDRMDVRIIFITLYSIVFCCCFFGNLLVILVVTLSRRLRSITNFFLANLAFADFCVGIFCVMQNLSIYLIDSWVFGEFLCRMYQFIHSLSYTASIFILVVICMERYFAIVHPITCKQILTASRLRMVIVTVWITAAVYSTPKFVFSKTIKNIFNEDGQEEEICVLDRKMYNSKLLDIINFVLLYVIPLLVMLVLYTKIAIALWRSSRGLSHQIAQQQQQQENNSHALHVHQHKLQQQQHANSQKRHQLQHTIPAQDTSTSTASLVGSGILSRKQSSKYEKRAVSISESQHDNSEVSMDSQRPIVSTCRKNSFYKHQHDHQHQQHHNHNHQQNSVQQRYASTQRGVAAHTSSNNVLRARRGVIRMLIIFVLTFALCNLPYHARKMWQYWSDSYRGDSNFNAIFTPLTFLVTYFNSGLNPLLYAFLSRNFRKGMKELFVCSWKKGKAKSSSNSSMHHKRVALQTYSLPTDTTHSGNDQV